MIELFTWRLLGSCWLVMACMIRLSDAILTQIDICWKLLQLRALHKHGKKTLDLTSALHSRLGFPHRKAGKSLWRSSQLLNFFFSVSQALHISMLWPLKWVYSIVDINFHPTVGKRDFSAYLTVQYFQPFDSHLRSVQDVPDVYRLHVLADFLFVVVEGSPGVLV